jgi:hypothetical protein
MANASIEFYSEVSSKIHGGIRDARRNISQTGSAYLP